MTTETESTNHTGVAQESGVYRQAGDYTPTEPSEPVPTAIEVRIPPLPYRRRIAGKGRMAQAALVVVYDHAQAQRELGFLRLNRILEREEE